MGEIHKIGDEYYIEFMARGLKYQQKAGANRVDAEKLLQEIEDKINHGEMGTIVRDIDVDIFIHDFLKNIREEHSAKTAKRFQSAVEHFHAYIRDKFAAVAKLSQVTPNVFEQYKNFLVKERKTPPKVINFTLVLLREFCEYARKTGYLNDNPLLHIKFVATVCRAPRCLDETELNILLAAAPTELKKRYPSGLEILKAIIQNWETDAAFRSKFEKEAARSFPGKNVGLSIIRHTFAVHALKRKVSLVSLAKMMEADDILNVMIYFSYWHDRNEDMLSSAHMAR